MAQRLDSSCRGHPSCCALDQHGCLSLASILASFSAPINEEQAWAVCYEAAKCVQRQWQQDKTSCAPITHLRHILIHKDGYVHPATASPPSPSSIESSAVTEHTLSSSLGLAIFDALDYGLAEEEERHLTPCLEQLIDLMTSADSTIQADTRNSDSEDEANRHEADEGIERDSGEDDEELASPKPEVKLAQVMEICIRRLSSPTHADSHYRAVCRALVAEALELSTFLQKISQGTQDLKEMRVHSSGEPDSDLKNLQIADWARLWVQVIRELRQGVKLKKVVIENNPPPIEYELTPYEILMDDIRGRRYKLNKVMVNGDIPPRVKKDAHAIILEFIRSRPPLHPVGKRKLKPLETKQSTPYDELMRSIRQEHSLKPTPHKTVETSRTKLDESDATPQPTRRLIKADKALLNFDEEDEDIPASPLDQGRCGFEVKQGIPQEKSVMSTVRHRTVALELATQTTCTLERRHSITVCESPMKLVIDSSQNDVQNDKTFQPASLPAQMSNESVKPVTFFQAGHWKQSMECLSLTLEEVVHIRNVLTKAELEGLLVDRALYQEVSKGKICFTCKKTRFSFFGQWGQKCRLCERNICDRCSTKMHIPTEHFASVPVFTLSPGSSSSGEDESPRSIWRLPDVSTFLSQRMSAGSAPSSPNLPSKQSRIPSVPSSVNNTPVGTPILGSTSRRRPLLRSRTLNRADSVRRNQLRGELMTVCKECRGMVRHAIVANRQMTNINQKKNRTVDINVNGSVTPPSGNQAIRARDLHLNLSPIY